MAKTPKRRATSKRKRSLSRKLFWKNKLLKRQAKQLAIERAMGQRRLLPLRPRQVVGDETIRTGLGKNVLYDLPTREKILSQMQAVGLQTEPQLIVELVALSEKEAEDYDLEEGWKIAGSAWDVIKDFSMKPFSNSKKGTTIHFYEVCHDPTEIWKTLSPWTESTRAVFLKELVKFATKPFFFQLSTHDLQFTMTFADGEFRKYKEKGGHVVGCVFVPESSIIMVFNTYDFDDDEEWFLHKFLRNFAKFVFFFPNELVSDKEYHIQSICDATEPGACQDYSFILPFKLAQAKVFENISQFSINEEKISEVYEALNNPTVSLYNSLRREVGLLGGKTIQRKRRKSPKSRRNV